MPNTITSTTQSQIDIEDVIDNIIIQKDGSCSLVIKTNAINFGLLSEEEQDATIYTYAAFLNSLTFNIQILIRSDIKDISGYIRLLEEQEIKQADDLKRDQITKYKSFISRLITERNVLEKNFYIIVPFSTLELGVAQSFTASFFTKKRTLPFEKSYIVEKAKASLEPKRDHIIRQISRIGIAAYQLNTQELIQLLFSMYNASSAQGQKITNTQEYTVPLVQPAYIKPKEEFMDNNTNNNSGATPTLDVSPPSSTLGQSPAVTTPPVASVEPVKPEPGVDAPVSDTNTFNPINSSPVAGAPEPTPVSSTPPTPPIAPSAPVAPASPVMDTPPVAPSIPPISPAPTPLTPPQPATPVPSMSPNINPTPTPSIPSSTPPTPPIAPSAPVAPVSNTIPADPISLDDAQQAINSAAVNLTGTTEDNKTN